VGGFRNVSADEAAQLVRQGARVLDIRTPDEYERLGHIPGALLLPVDLIASAPGALPQDASPLLVCCEHGIRSREAASFLSRAGFEDVLNLSGGMSCWAGTRVHSPAPILGPSSWLLENFDLVPQRARVLDVACGRGRHALLLAVAGFSVRAVDKDEVAIEELAERARRLGVFLETEARDLEASGVDLGLGCYDLVLGFRYLHRPLFPALIRALAPDGLFLYETFTLAQAARGKPKNPEFLLAAGELRQLVAPLKVLREREGEFDGHMVASVAATTPGVKR
jgi:tellurite methyltransferase